MKIELRGTKALIRTPYHPDFVKAIKNINGAKFHPGEKAWIIPAESVESARFIMRKIYGEDDLQPAEKIDVKITFEDNYESDDTYGLRAFGRQIAHAGGRDEKGRPGEGVDILEGNIHGFGTRKSFRTYVHKGTVILIHGVVRDLFEKEIDDWDGIISAEIHDSRSAEKNTSTDDLLKEKRALEERIAEIDNIIAGREK